MFNPAKSVIRFDHDVETGHTAPVPLPLGCDLCGGEPVCVKACPYEALLTREQAGMRLKILVAV